MTLMVLFTEGTGWIASALFLFSYYLASSGKVSGSGKTFNFMNLAGAVFLCVHAYLKDTMPVLIMEFCWGAIAIIAIYKIYFAHNDRH
jgi:hypothetical protein